METTIETQVEKRNAVSVETGLYLLALGIALLMRLAALGQHPLSEVEAGFAWQAWQAARGESFQMLGQPAYIQPTAGLFFLLGSGDVIARLLPAVVGSAVILFPYLLRERIGQKAALAAAFGLALDPISIAVSRQAGSPAIALGFLALALYLYQRRRPLAAGFFLGMLLMSGISFVFGLLAGLLSFAAIWFISREDFSFELDAQDRRLLLSGAGIALLLVGTLLTLEPQGLAAMLQAVPEFLGGWLGSEEPSRVSVLQGLAALLIYQPMAVLFGVLAWFNRRIQNTENTALATVFLIAFGLILLYPARQVWMLMWAVVPLWLLAGQMISALLSPPEEQDRLLVWGEAVFYVVLLAYWWGNFSKQAAASGFSLPEGVILWEYLSVDPNARVYFIRLLVSVFIPLLVVLMTVFVSWGWPGDAPLKGTSWGVGAFLVFYVVMAGWGFSRPPELLANEVWQRAPSIGYTDEMLAAIEEASVQITGSEDALQLVYTIDSPLVHWLLRDLPNAEYRAEVLPNQLPDVILNQDPSFSESDAGQFYAGQHFSLTMTPQWGGQPLPTDTDRWLVFREAAVSKEWAYLWTRADLFPLYEPAPAE